MSATDETVTFRTRGDQTATLPPLVILSRFLQHVLPDKQMIAHARDYFIAVDRRAELGLSR